MPRRPRASHPHPLGLIDIAPAWGVLRRVLLIWGIGVGAWGPSRAVVGLAEELRDPFMFGPVTAEVVSGGAVLTGIIWDAQHPLALIDGEPVTIGQIITGWQVITIQPDRIVIERNAQRLTIIPGSSFPAE